MSRIDFDAKRNKYAVYQGAQNDAILLTPLSYLSSVKWHSDFEYVGAVKTITVAFDINATTWPGGVLDRALVAHGMGYKPVILGSVNIDGVPVPAQGDFLITQLAGDVCAYNIYADATNIRIRCEPCQFTTSFRSLTVTATLHVCNIGANAAGDAVRNTPRFDGLDVTPTRFRAGYFDTDEKHFSVGATGSVGFYKGRSLEIGLGYSNFHNYVFLGFVHNVFGYSCTVAGSIAGTAGTSFFNGTVSSYQPVTVRTDCL